MTTPMTAEQRKELGERIRKVAEAASAMVKSTTWRQETLTAFQLEVGPDTALLILGLLETAERERDEAKAAAAVLVEAIKPTLTQYATRANDLYLANVLATLPTQVTVHLER